MTAGELLAQLAAAGASREIVTLVTQFVTLASRDRHAPSRHPSRDDAVTLAISRAKSAARSKKYRERKKAAAASSSRDASRDADKPALILTSLPSKSIQEEAISKKERRARVSKKPLPENWRPPDRAFDLAREHGVTVEAIEARFRDYLASKGVLYADYDAAFCNFIRNAPRFNGHKPSNGHAPRPGSREDTRERTVNALRKLDQYIDAHADDQGAGGAAREAPLGFLPLGKPS